MSKVCETGPLVYRPYTRRLESLIIPQVLFARHVYRSFVKGLVPGKFTGCEDEFCPPGLTI